MGLVRSELEAGLGSLSGGPVVQVRPGCHSIEELAGAEAVLRARAWHPDAKNVAYAFHLDSATSTYTVNIS
jgi:hypothetical protein